MRFLFITCFCLVFSGLALANGNVKNETFVNIQVTVGLGSHEMGAFVSGTNVNCAFVASWAAIADPPPGPAFDAVEIIHLKVKCFSDTDLDQTFPRPPPPPPHGPSFSKTIRIASTHFPDNSTISFEVKGKFRLIDNEAILQTIEPEVTHTATIIAYNKGLVLRTFEDWDSASSSYVVWPPGSGTLSYSAAAKAGTKQGHLHLRTNMKHTTVPGIDANGFVDAIHETGSATGLGAKLKESTFFFAFTHGEPPLFRSSFDDGVSGSPASAYDDQLQYSSEVSTYVSRAANIPPHNLVVMYACLCMGTVAPAAFGISGTSIDRVYCGFPRNIWSTTDRIGGTWTLDSHANILMADLAAFWTIEESIEFAHNKYPTIDDQANSMKMEMIGDVMTRITGVYLTPKAVLEANRYAWYWVL